MRISPIEDKVFGAVVTDVDLAHLRDDEFSQVHAAFLEFGFLLFPGQFLTSEDNRTFGERFGELEFTDIPIANQRRHKDGSLGDIFDVDSKVMRTNVGNETWHTDSTYKPLSSKCAMLTALVVPEGGGETELADARAGYAVLDDATKERIEGLSAFHSTEYSQANDVGHFPERASEGPLASVYHGEAYLRQLVKVHPETGVKNLFVGRHAFAIPGLDRDESRALLASLVEHIVSDESRVYRHHWRAGDTLLWDNRALLHRARPYDYSQPRVLLGTRVAGDPETELADYPTDPEAQAGRDALDAELALLRAQVKEDVR